MTGLIPLQTAPCEGQAAARTGLTAQAGDSAPFQELRGLPALSLASNGALAAHWSHGPGSPVIGGVAPNSWNLL